MQRTYQPAQRTYQPAPRTYQPAQRTTTSRNYNASNDDWRGNNFDDDSCFGSIGSKSTKKTFYVTTRLGGSYVNFTNSDASSLHLDLSGFGFTVNGAIGYYLSDNVRIEGEIGYHFNREVLNKSHVSVGYNEFDFLVGAIYLHKQHKIN